MESPLDRLLISLEVRLEAFAVVDVRRGFRLAFDPLDAVIIHYVLDGGGWLEVPGKPFTRCDAGSLIILPAGLRQAFRIDDYPEHDVEALESCAMIKDGLIRFDGTGGSRGIGEAGESAPDLRVLCGSMMAATSGSFGLFEGLKTPLVERFENIPTAERAFAMLRDEIDAPSFATRALAGALMKTCLILLIRKHLAALTESSPLIAALGDQRLCPAVAAVVDAPADAHTVASLASAAGMSRSAFARAFTQSFAMSPMEFVAKTRLHHAAELLRGTDLPVKVVAASIGFASRSHFSRAFRAAFGRDPRGYRKHHVAEPTPAPRTLRGDREDYALAPETA